MKTFIAVSAILFILAACSSAAKPAALTMPLSTETAALGLPDATSSTAEAVESSADVQPAAAWNGIPIMPGATAGEGDTEGYVFTVETTPGQVQEYYEAELGKLGWQLAGQESNDATLSLLFINGASEALTINIISKDGEALVLLAKQG